MEFCLDYVKKKNVTIMDLMKIEYQLKDELNINFKFTHYYDDTLEISIKKGDGIQTISVNRWFQSEERAYSEIKNYIESAYRNMICFYNNCLVIITVNDLVEILDWRC